MPRCKLQELYHEAKLDPPDTGDAHHMEQICRARTGTELTCRPDFQAVSEIRPEVRRTRRGTLGFFLG